MTSFIAVDVDVRFWALSTEVVLPSSSFCQAVHVYVYGYMKSRDKRSLHGLSTGSATPGNSYKGTLIGGRRADRLQAGIEYDNSDNMLSYLTLAHIFGRAAEEFALSCGAAIGYWQVHVTKFCLPSAYPE